MTDSTLATAATAAVDAYFSMWNEADPARRRQAILAAWTEDARYLDPMFSAGNWTPTATWGQTSDRLGTGEQGLEG